MFERINNEETGRLFRSLSVAAVCLFVFVISAYAQGLAVDTFRELEGDLTAQLPGTAKQDQNGKNAALIKIVTPEKGDFSFQGGSMGIVGTEQKTGEIWLYVPGEAEKLTISHQKLGSLRDYFYPISIKGGHTYEMLLNPGMGRYVTIKADIPQSLIYIDNKFVGESPVYNHYLEFGKRLLKAVGERHEGTEEVYIRVGDEEQRVINIPMQDLSNLFGDVQISVPNQAEILFEGRSVGRGQWSTSLRQGDYKVKTYLPDCDTTETRFTVEPMKVNTITAKSPTPHTGYLNIFLRTRNVDVSSIGNRKVDLTNPVVPVGTYRLHFARKGFVEQEHEYRVFQNQVTTDTITLQRIEYVKKLSFYLGAGYTIAGLGGITGILGTVIYNHDIQFSYTFGLNKTSSVNWYDNGTFLSSMNYQQSRIAVKYGYQFNLLRQLALTPQVGYAYHFLGGNILEGSNSYGDRANAHAFSIGLKILAVPFQHCYLFVAPEYDIAFKKSNTYTNISNQADFSPSHFAATIGILANF